MKVKDLIEELKTYNPDLEVGTSDFHGGTTGMFIPFKKISERTYLKTNLSESGFVEDFSKKDIEDFKKHNHITEQKQLVIVTG